MSIYQAIILVLFPALVCMFLVPILKIYSPRWGLVDQPSNRRIHDTVIPRSGGIAIFITTHLTLGLVLLLFPDQYFYNSTYWFKILVGSSFLFSIGIIDDKISISAWKKLSGQLLVSAFMFFCGYSFGSMLGQPLPEILDFILTIFWFILLMNAFNLIDGMDGICAGLGAIASLTVGLICLYLGKDLSATVLLVLAGSCIGFLRYNFNPATIFLGDAGSLFIGFIIAAISLEAGVRKSTLDVILAVIRRVSRTQLNKYLGSNKRNKIFAPDLDHLHHRLLKNGFSQRKVALILYAVAGIASISVLISIFITDFSLAVLLVGLLILLNIIFRKVIHLEIWTLFQWILRAFRRPIGIKRIVVHISYDFITLIALSLIVNYWFGFSDLYDEFLLNFSGVFFPFIIIYTFGNYNVIWSRARPWQFWKLNVEIILGELLHFIFLVTVVGIFRSEINLPFYSALQYHITRISLMSGLIVISRLTPIIMRDSSSWMRRYQTDDSHFKTLIIGSGYELAAYLRRAAYRNSHIIQRKIIGILDNEILHSDVLVFGYPVMGKYEDLNKILVENEITEIIICDDSYIESFKQKIDECKDKGIVVKHYVSDVIEL